MPFPDVQHANSSGRRLQPTYPRCTSAALHLRQREKAPRPIHSIRSRFCGRNAAEVRAVSRQDGRREPSVFHHRRNRTEPPGRRGDRQENDQDGKGNKKKKKTAEGILVCFQRGQSVFCSSAV